MTLIKFTKVNQDDVKILTRLWNQPHAQFFYTQKHWTLEQVDQKIKPRIEGEVSVWGFIGWVDQKAACYFQYYRLSDFPFKELGMTAKEKQEAVGIDFLLNEDFIGQGLSVLWMQTFIKEVLKKKFKICFADPDRGNTKAISMLKKVGFRPEMTVYRDNERGQSTELVLMKKNLAQDIAD